MGSNVNFIKPVFEAVSSHLIHSFRFIKATKDESIFLPITIYVTTILENVEDQKTAIFRNLSAKNS